MTFIHWSFTLLWSFNCLTTVPDIGARTSIWLYSYYTILCVWIFTESQLQSYSLLFTDFTLHDVFLLFKSNLPLTLYIALIGIAFILILRSHLFTALSFWFCDILTLWYIDTVIYIHFHSVLPYFTLYRVSAFLRLDFVQ